MCYPARVPTRILDIDILQPLPDIAPIRPREGLLLLLRVGPAPVGKRWIAAEQSQVVALDLARHVPGTISPQRFREARVRLGLDLRGPGELSLDEICETFRRESQLPDPAHPRPKVTVVVCTRARRDHLLRCLESLEQLDYPDVETILVDNNDEGESVFDLAGLFPVRYIKNRRPGLARSRNQALTEATGDIVAFTHDDAEVDPGWVDGLVRAFADPQVAAAAGPVLPRELVTRGQERIEELGCMGPTWFRQVVFGPEDFDPGLCPGLGANMAFRRSHLVARGGFDVHLGNGDGGEESDAFLSVLRAGSRVVFTPQAVVRHWHRVDLDEARSVAFHRRVGRAALLTSLLRRDRQLLRPVLRHVAREVFGRDHCPTAEEPGRPRSCLSFPLRALALVCGSLGYLLRVWTDRDGTGRGAGQT